MITRVQSPTFFQWLGVVPIVCMIAGGLAGFGYLVQSMVALLCHRRRLGW